MADDSDGDGAEDTMAERGGESRLKLWFFTEMDRLAVTIALVVVVFGVLVAASELAPLSLREAVRTSDPVETLFQALVTAIITGVTLVVTITQLVLSQELGDVGEQRERVSQAMEFDEDLEEAIDVDVSPAEPAALLAVILDAASASAVDVDDAMVASTDAQLRDRVREYADGVVGNAREVTDQLADAEFGTFDVVSAALDFNYSRKIHGARRFRNEHTEALPDEAKESLEELLTRLRFFSVAREHVKTLYFRWELTNLSREILYAAAPALVVSMAAVFVLDAPGAVGGSTLGVDNLVLVVCGAATVAVTPFLLLLAYILRIVTVTKRTLAPGPLVLRRTGQSDEES